MQIRTPSAPVGVYDGVHTEYGKSPPILVPFYHPESVREDFGFTFKTLDTKCARLVCAHVIMG